MSGALVVALLAVAALIGVPLWIVVITAGKSQGEALNPDLTLPSTWQYGSNFSEVWQQGRVPMAFFGSLLIMVPAVIGVLVLGSLASWILARRKSRVMAVFYALAISGIVLPPADGQCVEDSHDPALPAGQDPGRERAEHEDPDDRGDHDQQAAEERHRNPTLLPHLAEVRAVLPCRRKREVRVQGFALGLSGGDDNDPQRDADERRDRQQRDDGLDPSPRSVPVSGP